MIQKRKLLKILYSLDAYAPFRWANRSKVLILTYHRFAHQNEPFKTSSSEFASHLEYLKKYKQVVSLAEAVDGLTNKTTLPRNATVITIDDGYRDAYDVAFPILRQFGFPATIFAVTDFLDNKCWLWPDLLRYALLETNQKSVTVEFDGSGRFESPLAGDEQRLGVANSINSNLKKLSEGRKKAKIAELSSSLKVDLPLLPPSDYAPITWQDAREMERHGVTIESHTVTHPILTNVGQAELDFELAGSKNRLETALGRRVEHFCYPNGTRNEMVTKSVANAGYRSAVTTGYGFNDVDADKFLLRRIDAGSCIENFAQSVSGFEAARMNLRKRE